MDLKPVLYLNSFFSKGVQNLNPFYVLILNLLSTQTEENKLVLNTKAWGLFGLFSSYSRPFKCNSAGVGIKKLSKLS